MLRFLDPIPGTLVSNPRVNKMQFDMEPNPSLVGGFLKLFSALLGSESCLKFKILSFVALFKIPHNFFKTC